MKRKYDKKVNPFYTSTKWRKLRDVKINSNALCEACERRGLTVLAVEVDHIVSIKLDYSLRLDYDNLQSLCRQCHAKKTYAVDKRLESGKQAQAWEHTRTDGMPSDSSHPWYKKD